VGDDHPGGRSVGEAGRRVEGALIVDLFSTIR
jgi:hypothetical protein